MIKIVLLGAGNVATHLYKAISATDNISVIQWYNRTLNNISLYKNEVNITDNLNELVDADLYIICVSDDAIETLSNNLPFEKRLVVHTSGSASLYDIDKKHYRGVFYPLQTFSKDVALDFTTVPICIETLRKQDFKLLKSVGEALGCQTYKVNPDQRPALHLAAVFVNNFTNQLYRVAHEITESHGAEFDILKPLITETAKKVQDVSPYKAQTGPAKRNDKKTIKRHLKLLDNEHHEAIYKLMTSSIKKHIMEDKSYKEYLHQINTFIFDVDGVLTNGMVTITTSGEMIRHMNVKDGYAIKQALNHGFNICIISGGTNEGVRLRLQHLGIKDVYLGAHQKLTQYNEYISNNNINAENVLYMGDDIPDVPVLKQVGLATCPQDAVPEVKDICNYVSHKLGGEGCVRDVIQQVLKVQGKWDSDFDAQTF